MISLVHYKSKFYVAARGCLQFCLTYKLNANRNYDPWSYDHWICDLYTTNADTYLVFEKTSVSNVYRIRLKRCQHQELLSELPRALPGAGILQAEPGDFR